jgi:protease-4
MSVVLRASRILRSAAGLLILAGLITATCVCGAESDRRVPIPDDVYYYQPASTVFGSEAAWVNPAGLAKYDVAGFQFMADYADGQVAKSWGGVAYGDRVVTGLRHIDRPDGGDFDEWLVSAGAGLGQTISLGTSYRYFRNGPGIYNNRHFWTVGVIARADGPWSMAAVWSNLNRGKVDGQRTAVEHRYSIGYRPLGDRLTLAADMFLSSKNSLRDAAFRYHAEIVAIQGLYLVGSIDSDRNFEIGVRANLREYFTGLRSGFDRHGNSRRTTAFLGIVNKRQPSILPYPQRSLVLGVSGRPAENPPQPVFGARQTPFIDLITGIYRAADDPDIAEMVLDLKAMSLGFGQAQELREALTNFQSKRKRIVCHMSSPNNISYYVASVADTILIPPVSQLPLVGLRAELTFWAGTLEKLGIKIELLRIGDYKTAAETYTLRAATEENREQINRLLDDQFEQFVTGIAEGRGLSADSVRRIVDNGPYTSAEALRAGLVDGLSYRDRVRADFCARLPEISFRRYQNDTLICDRWISPPVLAVVVAEGDIGADGGDDDPFGRAGGVTPSPMAHAFAKAGSSPNVSGIVFRISSPGGFALAGEQIYRSVLLAAEKKPLVVSMGNVAASGGYYVAMSARKIFVDPATITGSIGIYGGKADFSGLYEKLDVGKELYTRGRFAGMLTNIRPFTSEEREKYASSLKAFYDHFVSLVAANRALPADSIDRLGQGRVWTGRSAKGNGLADELGGVRQALEYLADSLGLREYRVEVYPKRRPWFLMPRVPLIDQVFGLLAGKSKATDDLLPAVLAGAEDGALLARLPFDIDVQ